MSQAKVDQYKKEKADRKETIAKEKRTKKITKFCAGVVVGLLAVWIGISTVDLIEDTRPVETIYCETGDLDNYINSLYEAAETEDEAVVEETTEETETEETKTMYATAAVNVRKGPSTDESRVGGLKVNDEVVVIGEVDENGWQKILFEDAEAYVLLEYLSENPVE